MKASLAELPQGLLEDYYTLLSIPSISTDPAHLKDVQACADFVESLLKKAQLDVSRIGGGEFPIFLATTPHIDPDKPTILFYGHYDVQPVDPIELWESDPFVPVQIKDRIYARGAQDNKGQLIYLLKAIEHFLKGSKNSLECNIKVVIEGQEECGSCELERILKSEDIHLKNLLKADLLVVVDCGVPSLETPGIEVGFRGLITMELSISNGHIDHHSGVMGGSVYNPNLAMAKLLSSLYHEDGRVAIEGFYDQVAELLPDEKEAYSLRFDKEQISRETGVKAFWGDERFSLAERRTLCPTLEINGMYGGFTGQGFKTVIPFVSKAKLSCRLVPNQDPDKIFALVKKAVATRLPAGFDWELTSLGSGLPARVSPSNFGVVFMKEVYQKAFDVEPLLLLGGGSIPITTLLAKACGDIPFVGIGFGMENDRIHAPNESFSLAQLRMGYHTILSLLKEAHRLWNINK